MPQLALLNFTLGLVTVFLLGIIAYKKGAVDFSGFIAGLLIGWPIFWFGGWAWFVVTAYFFVASSILTKYKYDVKSLWDAAQEKGGARAWTNVFANGSVAAAAAVLSFVTGNYDTWFLAFLGAISTATADTIATEVGLLSKSPPRLVTRPWVKVEPGTSGGVTFLGTFAALIAAIVAGVLSLLARPSFSPAYVVGVAALSGLLGCFIDSVLGATIQGQYRCTVCGRLVEKEVHHGKEAVLAKGHRVVDNNVVNFLATLAGAAIALLTTNLS